MLPAQKLLERALNLPPILEYLGHLNEEERLVALACCYNCIALEIIQAEREENNSEVNPMEALIAAVGLVADGQVELVEDEEGIIRAEIPSPKFP